MEFADTKMDAAYARFNRGCCLGILGDWKRALEDFDKALKVVLDTLDRVALPSPFDSGPNQVQI